MKKYLLLSFFILAVTIAFSQKDSSKSGSLNGLFKKAGSVLNSSSSSKSGSGSSLSTDQIIAGLKEALSVGAKSSAGRLSATDGFFKDAVVKILMPEEVRKVETKLRALGMGKIVDQAVESLNRAAEDASRQATPIFVSAIKKMSVQDALGILKGSDTAATSYLKKSTSNDLTNAFRPVIESSLKKVDATKYWKEVFTLYNKFATTPVTSDINEYVTEGALKGIFYYVGEEEKKIRANPAARVSEILKTVFGGK
ncbi:MAG: DUF4197 domain-containing protein [Chitinophagaceae bacterium]